MTAYKSNKAQEKALFTYNQILTHWPVPYTEHTIDTNFGKTSMLISGSPASKPLILLHGGGGNSTMWIYNIAFLSKHFRVYTIDIIGEAGKSSGTRPSFMTDGYSCWLKEVLDTLAIPKAALGGASLGGTIAHQFSLAYPGYLTELILFAPPSLSRMRFSFVFLFILANLGPAIFAKNFLHYISSPHFEFPEWAIQAFVIQLQAYKLSLNKIPVISDQNLAKLPVKTLIIIGENEVLYDVNKIIKRINSVAPYIKVVVIPDAKHMVFADQPDLVNEKIVQFISK